MDAEQEGAARPIVISGFWRRVCALVVDLILLGIAGMLVGWVFFDALARLGAWAKGVGFAIALAYFGVFYSRLGGGQTVGKRLFGIRVVDRQGQLLSVPRALLRYVVLGVPFFVNGLPLGLDALNSIWGVVLSVVLFGGIFAIVYLYVFNRRTRQSLHDLAVGSYVERVQPEMEPKPLARIWRGHLLVVGLFALLTLAGPLVGRHLIKAKPFAGMLTVFQTLSQAPHVMSAGVNKGVRISDGTTSHYISATLRLDAPLTDDASLARRFAQTLAHDDPDIAREETVLIELRYGYDMGIASGWRAHMYTFTPDELMSPREQGSEHGDEGH